MYSAKLSPGEPVVQVLQRREGLSYSSRWLEREWNHRSCRTHSGWVSWQSMHCRSLIQKFRRKVQWPELGHFSVSDGPISSHWQSSHFESDIIRLEYPFQLAGWDAKAINLTWETACGLCSATKQGSLPVEASSVPHAKRSPEVTKIIPINTSTPYVCAPEAADGRDRRLQARL